MRRSIDYLHGKRRVAAELISLLYIAIIAEVAIATGAIYILFPELGALSHDIFTRPRGSWARAPLLLVMTPVMTAVVGTLITRNLPYGYLSVVLTVAGALAIVLALRSPIAPAISAGLLPLILGVRSWWYPPGIVFGTVLLAILSIVWRRFVTAPSKATVPSPDEDTAPGAESWWPIAALMLLVVIAVAVVEFTHMRFVLFPPLVVIGFEMFVHTRRCPWADRIVSLPMVCVLTAAGGFLCQHYLGVGPGASLVAMAWGVLMLRAFDLHVPPALAVALLPQVMDSPTIFYPVAVGVGTLLMTASFALYARFARPLLEG
jgi:hypothetical protein